MRHSIISFVPDEWVGGARAFALMVGIAAKTPKSVVKHIVGIVLPLSVGVAVYPLTRANLSSDFILGALAVLGVMFGFVVTLMLFTGNTDGTSILNSDQARRYGDKVYYLLFSQCLTLGTYLMAMLSAAAWLYSNKGGTILYVFLSPVVYGTLALALVRTVLLPAQIFERHHFAIEAMIEQKRQQEDGALSEARRQLVGDGLETISHR